jgi:hypothetical protein
MTQASDTPIKPTNAASTPAQTAPPSTTIQASNSQSATATAPIATTARVATVSQTAFQPSPLKEQYRAPYQPECTPVELIFLSGPYKGKSLDLGLAVNEISHSQSANWESQTVNGIRVGVNFTNIGGREISMSLEYADVTYDIIHLAEGVALLQQIGDGEVQPPLMLLTQGDAKNIGPMVCNSFQQNYSEPFAGRTRGFRHAKIDLKFTVIGGKASNNALAPPIASTPLGDETKRQTQLERQRQGTIAAQKTLLLPCLGEEGSNQLTEMIDQGKLTNVEAILQLPADVFVNGTLGGLFNKQVLADQRLQDKLRADLASTIAANEDGVGNTTFARQFAEALITGDFSHVSRPAIQAQAQASKPDYDQIYQAILNQELGDDASVFADGNTAGERLRSGFGTCGMKLRSSNTGITGAKALLDAEVLNAFNTLLADESNTQTLKDDYGLTESQIRHLRKGQPFQSKEEFMSYVNQDGSGISGYAIWSKIGNPATGGNDSNPSPTEPTS